MKKKSKPNIPLIPVISGALALIAVTAVIIIVVNAGGDAGLYITEASGGVSISNSSSKDAASSAGNALKQGDILTVGEGAICKLMYKSKKNSDDNFIIVSPETQLVITDDFNGKKSGEIYLNRGSLMCNLAGKDNAGIYVRTADSMVYPETTVTKISYTADGFESYTTVYTFMGNSKIQLYDAQGNTVNDPEFLVQRRTGRVTTNDLGPEFYYLNTEFPLTELTASDLKNLVALSTLIEGFPYTSEELKAAYDSAPDKSGASEPGEQVTEDTSELIQTAAPIETSPAETETVQEATTGPAITTKPVQTTVITRPSETQPPVSDPLYDPPATTAGDGRILTVIIDIDGDETIQEVPYGGNAEQPADPYIEGKTFRGWSASFNNITDDTVIYAVFDDGGEYQPPVTTADPFGDITTPSFPSSDEYHTVTVRILDKTTTLTVKHGEAASLPSEISIEGYIFKGWDKDYSQVFADMTITAILEPIGQWTVTFIIDGSMHTVSVANGGTAIPPFTPIMDSQGNMFTGWDRPLTNITADTVITALFGVEEFTVTFMVDGQAFPVKVKKGEAAVPPFTPITNAAGTKFFTRWDRDFSNVTSDMTVTALFE